MSGFPQHSCCQAHSAGLPEGQHLSAWALQTPVNTGNTTFNTLHWRTVFKCTRHKHNWTFLRNQHPYHQNQSCVERKT